MERFIGHDNPHESGVYGSSFQNTARTLHWQSMNETRENMESLRFLPTRSVAKLREKNQSSSPTMKVTKMATDLKLKTFFTGQVFF